MIVLDTGLTFNRFVHYLLVYTVNGRSSTSFIVSLSHSCRIIWHPALRVDITTIYERGCPVTAGHVVKRICHVSMIGENQSAVIW